MTEFFNRTQLHNILSPTDNSKLSAAPQCLQSPVPSLCHGARDFPVLAFICCHSISCHLFSGRCGLFVLSWRHHALESFYALFSFIYQLWIPLSPLCICPVLADPIRPCMIDTSPTRLPLTCFPMYLSECSLHRAPICLPYINLAVCLGHMGPGLLWYHLFLHGAWNMAVLVNRYNQLSCANRIREVRHECRGTERKKSRPFPLMRIVDPRVWSTSRGDTGKLVTWALLTVSISGSCCLWRSRVNGGTLLVSMPNLAKGKPPGC